MNNEEKINQRKVACDGGVNGHPLIYLEISDDDKITCPYCGKVFIYGISQENK